ncbi:MAG: hypothetical protein ACFE96_06915, partial [Candidatus Hermodarchaeota archaeon]
YMNDITGHGGAIPGYLTNIVFKTVNNGKYGFVVMLNKGSSLTNDENLVDIVFPAIINVLLNEAAQLAAT